MSGCIGCGNERGECVCAARRSEAHQERIAAALEGMLELARSWKATPPSPSPGSGVAGATRSTPAHCGTTWAPDDETDSTLVQCGADSHQCDRERGHIGRHECLCGRHRPRDPTFGVGRVRGHLIPEPLPSPAAAMAGTQPTRCLTQWPWVGAEPGGACGPDATVGGLRSECHHRCAARVGHEGLCRCECGKLQTSVAPAPSACGAAWVSESMFPGHRHVCIAIKGHDGPHICTACADHNYRGVIKALPAAPTWRPIETAPKDGSKVMLRTGRDEIFIAQWSGDVWRLGRTSYDRSMLTHWCPLPVMP